MIDMKNLKLHWTTTAPEGAPTGQGHVYVVDSATGTKRASIWGGSDLKPAMADLFVASPKMLATLEQFASTYPELPLAQEARRIIAEAKGQP